MEEVGKTVKTAGEQLKPYQFKKGESGNPNGRPPGSGISITTEIKKKLAEVPEGKNKTYLHYLIEQILKKAVIEGDQQTIKQIWNYIDGMPRQELNLGGNLNVTPIYGSKSTKL